jgi:hypothetical protein
MTKTLYRPVSKKELDLILASNKFPPRLPEQPIFYPVTNLEYAIEITEKWNKPAYGTSFVVAFDVDAQYINQFEVQNVGNLMHDELWIPAEQLDEFNSNIIGQIRVVYTT